MRTVHALDVSYLDEEVGEYLAFRAAKKLVIMSGKSSFRLINVPADKDAFLCLFSHELPASLSVTTAASVVFICSVSRLSQTLDASHVTKSHPAFHVELSRPAILHQMPHGPTHQSWPPLTFQNHPHLLRHLPLMMSSVFPVYHLLTSPLTLPVCRVVIVIHLCSGHLYRSCCFVWNLPLVFEPSVLDLLTCLDCHLWLNCQKKNFLALTDNSTVYTDCTDGCRQMTLSE